MVKVSLENISKYFGEVIAANKVNLNIKDGEFFTFLGPSGCGKTTTMRMIAGLEFPSDGKILYDEKDVTQLPSFKRNTGMVFQNYALWPHMKVRENVAYGLEVRKIPKDEVDRRVQDVIDLVGLKGMGDRFPNQLSGGQQQRVALATTKKLHLLTSTGQRAETLEQLCGVASPVKAHEQWPKYSLRMRSTPYSTASPTAMSKPNRKPQRAWPRPPTPSTSPTRTESFAAACPPWT